jgi:uncharacterized protein (TIGR02145 family)/prepilin-type N-terminal cleavage/methylation domain-containing protein
MTKIIKKQQKNNIINNNIINNTKAFTLIELLVVIAIIGILTALAVVSLQNSRRSARDAKRVADVKQIQIALELYYQDNNSYPPTLNPGESLSSNSITYMEQIPYPPTNLDGDCSTTSYIYSTSNDNSYYTINFCISNNVGSFPAGNIAASPRGLGEWACGEILLDERDGQSYTTVQIGNQCWMSENMNYDNGCTSTYSFATDVGWCGCYNNDPSKCNDGYGKLYQWSAAMNNNTSTTQGVCPDGWHVPTDTEWTELTTYINSNPNYRCNGTNNYIAKALASVSGWTVNTTDCAISNNQSINNSSGFNTLPSGWRDDNFHDARYFSYFWLSSISGGNSFYCNLRYNTATVVLSSISRTYGFSVRCLKDN